jgi:C1A family cysteine protease
LIQKYQNITKDEVAIKEAVYEIGPLSILLDFEGLFHYKSGVASPRFCGSWPNHALILVGYGIKGEDYWLIKNSWGPVWGINGYFMLKRGSKKCGVDQWAVTGVLKE